MATKPKKPSNPLFGYFFVLLVAVVMILSTLAFTIFSANVDPFTLQDQLIELRISQERTLERRIDLNKCLVDALNAHNERWDSLCEEEGKKGGCVLENTEAQNKCTGIYLTASNDCHRRYH